MPDLPTLAATLDDGIIELVRAAPDLTATAVEACARTALGLALAAAGGLSAAAHLALAIERTLDGIADGVIAQGVGLPALAMAADTLRRGLAVGTGAASAGIDASRFELETLFPIAGRTPPAPRGVDVALARLSPTLALTSPAAARARAQRLGELALAGAEPSEAFATLRGRYG